MKKGVFLGVIGIIFLAVTFSYSAITRSLIEFTNFEQNMRTIIEKDKKINEAQIASNKMLDLSKYGFEKFKFTNDSFDLDKWRVILTSSANTLKNNVLSYTRKVKSLNRFKEGPVLGARIHFIEGRFLSWALVKPPYDFFAYFDDGSYVNSTNAGASTSSDDSGENTLVMGVLVNVGQIKSISSWIYGLNYKMQAGVRLRDRNDIISDYFLGSLYFDGWRRLVWFNSEYADNIEDRIIQRLPLYPKSYPFIVFDSFIIWKPEAEAGGDFIVYFGDVVVEFDKAIVREPLDIDDESEWGILAKERLERKLFDTKKLTEEFNLREQEKKRQNAKANEGGITTP